MASNYEGTGIEVGTSEWGGVLSLRQLRGEQHLDEEAKRASTLTPHEREMEALEQLQQACFDVLDRRGKRTIRDMCNIIYLALKTNEYPSDHNDPTWKEGIEEFVERLRQVADLNLRKEKIDPVLHRMRLNTLTALEKCVECFLSVVGFKEKCRLILGLYMGDYIDQFQNACFDEEFVERVLLLPPEFSSKDGRIINENERTTMIQFLRQILAKLRITVWLEFDELIPLVYEEYESAEPSTLKVTIALSVPTAEVKPVPQFLIQKLREIERKAKDVIPDTLWSGPVNRLENADAVDMTALEIVRGTMAQLLQKCSKFVERLLIENEDEPAVVTEDDDPKQRAKVWEDEPEMVLDKTKEVQPSPLRSDGLNSQLAKLQEENENCLQKLNETTEDRDRLCKMVTENDVAIKGMQEEIEIYERKFKEIYNPTTRAAYEERIKDISETGKKMASIGSEISKFIVSKDRSGSVAYSAADTEYIKQIAHELKGLSEEQTITAREFAVIHLGPEEIVEPKED